MATATTTSTSAPWPGVQPYLLKGYDAAANLFNQGGMSPDTTNALNLIRQRATAGSPLIGQAQGLLGQTLGGDFLNQGNPGFQGMVQQIEQSIRPQISSVFGRSLGGVGSGAAANAYQSNLQNTVGRLAYQNYDDERSRQMQALGLAPGLAGADYSDLAQLRGVGQTIEEFPWANLARYTGAIGGGAGGGTSTTTQPIYGGNTALNALGIGAAGAGILGSLFGAGGVFR